MGPQRRLNEHKVQNRRKRRRTRGPKKENTKGERRGGSSVEDRGGCRAYIAGTGVWITRGDAVLIAITRDGTYYAPIELGTCFASGRFGHGPRSANRTVAAPRESRRQRRQGVRNAAHDEQGSAPRPCPAHPPHLAVGHRVREHVGLASESIM